MTAAIASTPLWDLKPRIVEALRTVQDPEIPVNIHDLGLVYAIEIYDRGRVRILMTLTTPGCPVAQEFPAHGEGSAGCERLRGRNRVGTAVVGGAHDGRRPPAARVVVMIMEPQMNADRHR